MSDHDTTDWKAKPDSYWRQTLTPEQYRVCRGAGTECAFSGILNEEDQVGVYSCICCQQPLFDSSSKFHSGTGWPSWFQPVNNSALIQIEDRTHGMVRIEVRCSRCNAHLGHVFDDGPDPTGLRYCINSISLNFKAKGEPSP